jgi:dihydrofolate synthase/folylpolyglutamate synthase
MKIQTIAEAEAALLPFVPLVAQLTGKDTTLDRIRPLMALLGNPHEKVRVVHIAGTSGKTSTAYYMAGLLKESGFRVGLTVSPHVDLITERVQVDGQPLPEAVFCRELGAFLDIVETAPQKPSYFELLYAFALWTFANAKLDYAVVETGMGGLYDATNVVTRADKVCIITDIGFDHMHILGTTLPEITAQKIGIVHTHNPVLMYEQGKTVMQVVRAWATNHKAPLHTTTEDKEQQRHIANVASMPLYQQRNWLLAYFAYRFLQKRDGIADLQPEQLQKTQAIQVPGRMDIRTIGRKTIVMDGAHNAQKMAAFIGSYQERYPQTRPVVLLALKQGKEYQELAPLLVGLSDHIILTTFYSSQDLPARAIDPALLATAFREAGIAKVEIIADLHAAFSAAVESPENSVIITGSFYLLSQLRNSEKLA